MPQRLTDADFTQAPNARLTDADFSDATTAPVNLNATRVAALQGGSAPESINMGGLSIPTGTNLLKYQDAANRVEGDIAHRHSFIKDAIANPPTLQELQTHPFKTTGRTLMGAAELIGGTTADLALAAQRGTADGLGADLYKTWTGQRPSSLGDVAEASSVPGISNPIAAGGIDIMANAAKGSPMSGLGELISPITGAAWKAGSKIWNPKITATMSNLSGIPPKLVQTAVDNPHYLDDSYIAAEKGIIKPQFDKVVRSLEDNPHATVNLSGAANVADKLGIVTKLGVPSSKMSALSPAEQDTLGHYVASINHATTNPTSFTTARGMLVKMDKDLADYWSAVKAGRAPHADTYEGLLTQLRDGIRKDIGTQYPAYDTVATRMSEFMKAQHVNEVFQSGKGSFFRSLPLRVGLTGAASALGGMPGAAAALASFYGSTPAGQAAAIRTAARVHALISEPTVGVDIARILREKADNSNSQTE